MFRVVIAQFEGATTLRAPPLAAGLLAATIRREPALAGVALRVLAQRRALDATATLLAEAELAGLSLYTWNVRYALEVARRARALRPDLRLVVGGPSVPRRPEASARFLAAHPWIEALVLGEGERAFVEIVRAARAGEALHAIAGVVARDGDAIVAGPPRVRLDGAGFAAIGSPYLDGTFAELVASGEVPELAAAVLETNRGCPFACTFCDWGQATQSRVHELPADRVERELAWIAERRVPYLYIVDANFGIRRRDVELTEAIGRLARTHGAPQFVFFHLTKNATARNLKTVEILRAHGVATQVALSMQDFDPDVLVAIRRDNIRPADALALRERCHAQGLPTMNELLLGLPAQTAASIRRSVAAAITPYPGDSFFLYLTRVLDNAELAEPAYRARHGIETRDVPWWPPDPAHEAHVLEHEEIVVATAALPIEAWRDAYAFGYLLSALWNQRLLQTALHVARFVAGLDVATVIDALLGASSPRLAAVRAELGRFSAAVLAGEATTLPVTGWGPRRREPADAVCARVLEDPRAFYDEVAAAIAACPPLAAGHAEVLREAVRWDALHLPPIDGAAYEARFEHDWLAYEAQMGACPVPAPGASTHVRAIAWPWPEDAAARLELFLALGWAKQPRVIVQPLPPAVEAPVAPAVEAPAAPAAPHVASAGDPSAVLEIQTRPLVAAPAEPAARRARARADGFLYVPRLVPAARVAPLREVVDAALRRRGWVDGGRSDPALRLGRWDDARWIEFLGEVLGSAPYRELAAAPELLAVMADVIGEAPRMHVGDVCRLVSPGALDLTTPPHQDAAYLPDAADVWTAWLPLDACPVELGPLALLAGSHRGGLRAHAPVVVGGGVVGTEVPAAAIWSAGALELGDVLVFSALTVHRALPNVTADRLRVSVDYRYRPAGAPR